jgi:hypothetical protein
MKKSQIEDTIKIYSLELRVFLLELEKNLRKYNIKEDNNTNIS